MKKLLIIIYSVSCSFLGFAQQPDSTWIIKNLVINSVADDYSLFMLDTALLFTSTRKNSREEKLLEYTEKVYYVIKADTSFGKVKKFSYKANTDANSALVGCSKTDFFFYRSYFPDDGELFKSSRKQGTNIKPLKKIPYILSDFDENSVTTKGDSLYFTSNRSGNYEIYFQIGKDKPIPVDTLNSPFDEMGVWISTSGKQLYFNSNREGKWFSMYRSDLIDGQWNVPQKLPFPFNIPDCDNIDYRQYNDSMMFWASNRSGGLGGYDIYQLIKPKKIIPPPDTVKLVVDSIPKQDTLKRQVIPVIPIDSLVPREQLITKLIELDLYDNVYCEIQLGAYETLLKDVKAFKNWFKKCIEKENVRMDVFEQLNRAPLRKFIIDTVYTDVNKAIDKQVAIVDGECFPSKPQGAIPFIALLKNDTRYAIFWSKKTSENKEEFWIVKGNQEIWRSK